MPITLPFGLALISDVIGHEQDAFEQVVDALLLFGRNGDDHRVAAPVIRDKFLLGELLFDKLGVGIGFVDLVHAPR